MASSSRRKKDRSSEEVYVGPATLLTPSQSPESDAPRIKRARRLKGIATDIREIPSEEITIHPGRVGGPVMCRLPAVGDEVREGRPTRRAFDNGMRAKITRILDEEKVIYEDVDLQQRRWYFSNDHSTTDEEDETVIVGCSDAHEDNRAWYLACSKIRKLFVEEGFEELNIEIASTTGITPLRSWEVELEHPVMKIWGDIRINLHKILYGRDWISLELFRRGKDYSLDGTCPVTIVVTIEEESLSDWNPIVDEIVEVIDRYGMNDMAVEISRGTIVLHDDQARLKIDNWEHEAKVGHSIGPRGHIDYAGTLGGFLDLEISGQRRTYGVTCFHCVAPPTVSNPRLSNWEKEGIFPGDPTNDLAMDHPALGDTEETLRFYEKNRAKLNTEEHRRIGAMLADPDHPDSFVPPREEAYFHRTENFLATFDTLITTARAFIASNSHHLGTVYAASGKRRVAYGKEKEVMCDWALIDVAPHRMSRNYLPKKNELPAGAKSLFFAASDVIPDVGTLRPNQDQDVFKKGRTTQVTCGHYVGLRRSDIKSWKSQPDGTYKEVVGEDSRVLGMPHRLDNMFGLWGDSGAFVIDRSGEFLGLYWGGNTATGAGYFTGADPLFQDIKRITGATSVEMTG